MNRRSLPLLAVLALLLQAGSHAQTNKRIPELPEILGAAVDPVNDLLWLNDTSAGNNTNASKRISIAELANVSSFTDGNFLAANSVEFPQIDGLVDALAAKQAADADLNTWAATPPGTGTATAISNAVGAAGGLMLHNGSVAGATVDAGGFDGNLTTTDNTMQELAQKLDDLSGNGDVLGPALSVTNNVAVFDGATGKLLGDSGVGLSNVALRDGGFAQFTSGSASSANLRSMLTDENGTGSIMTSNGSLASNTGLPVATGISGLGTGVATALSINTGSAGAPLILNGVLGTPSSGVLTNATGLPLATGISGLGAGVATALAINTGSAGAPVLLNGALGTPSSATISGSFVVGGTFGAVNGANLTALSAANIGSGTLSAARGGTGVSNTGTITLAGNLVTTGAFNTTFTQAGTTTIALPSTSATMARTDAAQSFTGTQTFSSAPVFAALSGIVFSNTGTGTSAITSAIVGQTLRVTGTNTYAFGALDLADADAVTGLLPPGNIATAADYDWTGAHDFSGGSVVLPAIATLGATTANVGTLSFEGTTVDAFQLLFAVEDPTVSDKTVTFRNATGTVVISGDTFTGDVTGTLDTDGTTALTIQANSVALGTDTTGNYASSASEGGSAETGDSATAFFSTGTVEDARLPTTQDGKTLTNATVARNGALGTDDTLTGDTLAGLTAGATIAQWEAVYIGGSSTYLLADANGSGTYPVRGLAVAGYSSTNAAIIITNGTVRNDAWAWTPGNNIYLSATAGGLTQTVPSTSGDKIQVVGYALTADIMVVALSADYGTAP